MRFGLWLLAALGVGALGAHFLLQDKGYVLINFRGYIIETSVPILIAALVLMYVIARILMRALRAPRKLGQAASRFQQKKAAERFTRGLIEMAEGNWSRGEKLLTKGVARSDTPLLNYLAAARAAQLQGEYERRDQWLKLAYEETPAATTAVLLTQAELQFSRGQHEEALATLRRLDEQTPNHQQSLTLQARIYDALKDWGNLRTLLPKLSKRSAMDATELQALGVRVHTQSLAEAGAKTSRQDLGNAWQAVPKELKKKPRLQAAYVDSLVSCGDIGAAEQFIYKTLKQAWDGTLILKYGELVGDDPAKQLQRAEAWLRLRGEDPDLLLTAARLCVRSQLWGKARSYLETSLAIKPRPEAYEVYGRLLEHMGEADGAADAFRLGLSMTTNEQQARLPATLASDVENTGSAEEPGHRRMPEDSEANVT